MMEDARKPFLTSFEKLQKGFGKVAAFISVTIISYAFNI